LNDDLIQEAQQVKRDLQKERQDRQKRGTKKAPPTKTGPRPAPALRSSWYYRHGISSFMTAFCAASVIASVGKDSSAGTPRVKLITACSDSDMFILLQE